MSIISRLPNVAKRMQAGIVGTPQTINIGVIGSSVGNGAAVLDSEKNRPGATLARLLNARFNTLGSYAFTEINRCVDGSVIFSGYDKFCNMIAPVAEGGEGLRLDALLVVYGMNDGATAAFNSGQTYTLFCAKLEAIFDLAASKGIDVIVASSPHPHLYKTSWAAAPGATINFPVGGQPLPLPADSVVQVPVPGKPTRKVSASWRHHRCNEAMQLITDRRGGLFIDAGAKYLAAVDQCGEDACYNSAERVHPNLYGHQVSYWAAFEEAVNQ